jgi:hypothetical protein
VERKSNTQKHARAHTHPHTQQQNARSRHTLTESCISSLTR